MWHPDTSVGGDDEKQCGFERHPGIGPGPRRWPHSGRGAAGGGRLRGARRQRMLATARELLAGTKAGQVGKNLRKSL